MRNVNIRIPLVLILIAVMLIMITACNGAQSDDLPAANDVSEAASVPEESEESAAPTSRDAEPIMEQMTVAQSEMWRVELVTAELTDSLLTTRVALQYGGGVLETTNEVMPSSGYNFLIVGLIIEKTGVGRAAFSWNDAHITDSDGNVFFRHPNDTFLTHLNIPRLRGTDMVFGEEYGYVCFEIPFGSAGLRFVADEGNIVLDLGV